LTLCNTLQNQIFYIRNLKKQNMHFQIDNVHLVPTKYISKLPGKYPISLLYMGP
jgi:hypothetical protein